MTDRPILFSGPMVRALLDGRKTQTRRVIDFPGIEKVIEFVRVGFDKVTGAPIYEMKDAAGQFLTRPAGKGFVDYHYSPRFAVGDRIYVREAWRAQEHFDALSPTEIGDEFEGETGASWCPTFFEADRRCDGSSIDIWQQSPPGRVRAAMHMPRWASRLTLTVTDVRVQRLQEISHDDAVAEGVSGDNGPGQIGAYITLWDHLNAARGFGWDVNPWVVAVSFTVGKGNIDADA